MYQLARPLFFRTETQLHAGSGSDLGHIDLPIQREKHTDIPNIQSSSLKGAFRQHIEQFKENGDDIRTQLVFGFDDDGSFSKLPQKVQEHFSDKDSRDYAGSIAFTDARLLLFPIKSYKGIFALATCPRIISQFVKEMQNICGLTIEKNFDFVNLGDKVTIADNDFLKHGNKVILEEYAFEVSTSQNNTVANEFATYLKGFGLGDDIAKRLVVVSDDIFRDFTRLSTEVITRIKINNETGTVQNGALFSEEYLPAESYMYTILAASRVFAAKAKDKNAGIDLKLETANDVLGFVSGKLTEKSIMQIGGNTTLGKGIVQLFPNQLQKSK